MTTATISNVRAVRAGVTRGKPTAGRQGSEPVSYYHWTVDQLKRRAKEMGLSGYSALSKEELVFKLRYS